MTILIARVDPYHPERRHVAEGGTAIRHYLPASSAETGGKKTVARKRPDTGNPEIAVDLTEKLNELAKARPFSTMYRVKKYDPL
jgi:hypothetical protein